MAFCQNCGTKLEDTFEYCPECGSPVLIAGRSRSEVNNGSTRKCLHCGEILEADVNLCPTCGHAQGAEKTAGNATEDITQKVKQSVSDIFSKKSNPLLYILIVLLGLYILTKCLYITSFGEILIIAVILACVYKFYVKNKEKKQ